MPNLCSYDMHVKGKENQVVEFIRNLCIEVSELNAGEHTIESEYNGYATNENGRTFARIFDSYAYDCYEDDDDIVVCVAGDCAWSVYTCMFAGEGTYYKNGGNKNLTNIIDETRRCSVTVEIYSSEPGLGFAEHYVITPDAGNIVNEEREYYSLYWDKDEYPTFEEFLAGENIDANEVELTEDDFVDGFSEVGGFVNNQDFSF